jgi:hypothetical protein
VQQIFVGLAGATSPLSAPPVGAQVSPGFGAAVSFRWVPNFDVHLPGVKFTEVPGSGHPLEKALTFRLHVMPAVLQPHGEQLRESVTPVYKTSRSFG